MSEAASTHEAADAWSQWAARYRDVRAATDALCAPLSAEDSAVQSMPDASPAKWHLAHTTWFFEVFVLAASDPSHELYQPLYLELFNSYYNAIGPQYPRPERGLLTRPSLEEVKAYREHVDRGVLERLAAGDVDLDTLELGLHHEQQHQELILTDIKHLFSRNPSFPAYRARGVAAAARPPEPLRWHAFEGGVRSIGHDGRGFAFDNEEPRHARVIEPFELASRTITNGEFSEFIDDGGYDEPQL